MTSRLAATIHGTVQGVGYRAFVRATAAELGVMAQGTNNPDGTVIVHAEGEKALLESMLSRLHEGPPHASVEHIDVIWHNHEKESSSE
jgi:acylphosphatase